MASGLLDTNVFIHAQSNDAASDECRGFLFALERGDLNATIEPLVLHELSDALPRYVQRMRREDIARYLLMVLGWDGVEGDKDTLVDAVERWQGSSGLSFVDAYLAAAALRRACPVFTKNVSDLRSQGVAVPDPLPTS